MRLIDYRSPFDIDTLEPSCDLCCSPSFKQQLAPDLTNSIVTVTAIWIYQQLMIETWVVTDFWLWSSLLV